MSYTICPNRQEIFGTARRLSQLAQQQGAAVYIMGKGEVVVVHKDQEVAATGGTTNEPVGLVEGQGALRYLMNARHSDCLLLHEEDREEVLATSSM